MRQRYVLPVFSAAMVVPAGLALAIPTVIYSDIATSPTSLVPGLGGARFVLFERPYRSPNGLHWAFTADTDLATTQDEVILLGSGLSGTVVVQEGVTQVAPPATEVAGLLDRNLWVTSTGDLAYATNTDGATTSDEIIGRRLGGVYTAPIREGGPAPGLPGVTLGTSNHAAYITAAGAPGFVGTGLIGTPGGTATDSAVFFDTGVVAQEGVTIPAGQAGGGTATWQIFDFEETYFANTGTAHLIRGDTNAATGDDILVFNGTVVLQEAQVVPGSGFVSVIATGGPLESILTANGDWFSRGGNVDLEDWLVRNGTVLATTDDVVPGGLPGELFDDATFTATFFSMTGDGAGNYVYGGVTTNADANANAVLVYNNQFVLLREGDAVDLDGNGLLDDNTFISVFNNDDALLSGGLYHFTADLRDAAGAALGQAFIILPVPEPATLSLLSLAGIGLLRRRR